MTTAISLRSGKVIKELVSKKDENRVKLGDDSTQQQNTDKEDINTSTYRPVVPFL